MSRRLRPPKGKCGKNWGLGGPANASSLWTIIPTHGAIGSYSSTGAACCPLLTPHPLRSPKRNLRSIGLCPCEKQQLSSTPPSAKEYAGAIRPSETTRHTHFTKAPRHEITASGQPLQTPKRPKLSPHKVNCTPSCGNDKNSLY